MSNIRVTIAGDASSLTAATRSAGNSLRQLNATADQSSKSLQNLDNRFATFTRGAAAAGGLVAIGAGLRDVLRASSDVEQQTGAVNTVFKAQADQMNTAAAGAVRLGLATSQYQQQAALLGSQLKNLGVNQLEVADRTQSLIELGADLAATFGGTTQKAVESLSSALRGEYERIEAYGITLRQSQIDSEAATNGITKAQATLNLILGQSGDALGQAEREFNTYAATSQRAAAQIENTKAAIGEGLLPVATQLTSVFTSLAAVVEAVPGPMFSIAAATGIVVVGKKALELASAKAAASLTLYSAQTQIAARNSYAAAAASGSFTAAMNANKIAATSAATGALANNMGKVQAAVGASLVTWIGFDFFAGKANESLRAQVFTADDVTQALTRQGKSVRDLTIDLGEWQGVQFFAGDDNVAWIQEQITAVEALRQTFDQTKWEQAKNVLGEVLSFGKGEGTVERTAAIQGLDSIKQALEGLPVEQAREQWSELVAEFEASGASAQAVAEAQAFMADALLEGETAAEAATRSMQEVTQAYKDAKGPVDDYLAAVLALQSPFFAQQQASAQYIEILQGMQSSLAGVAAGSAEAAAVIDVTTGSYNLGTEAGRNAEAAARDLSTTTWELVAAMMNNGATQDEVRGKVEFARAAFINQMVQMGLNETQAANLADQYGLIPNNVQTDFVANTATAYANTIALRDLINSIQSKTVTVDVYQRVFGPGGSADTIERNIDNLAGGVNSQGSAAGMTSVTSQGVTSWRVTPQASATPQVVVMLAGERQPLRTRTAGSELEAVAL